MACLALQKGLCATLRTQVAKPVLQLVYADTVLNSDATSRPGAWDAGDLPGRGNQTKQDYTAPPGVNPKFVARPGLVTTDGRREKHVANKESPGTRSVKL